MQQPEGNHSVWANVAMEDLCSKVKLKRHTWVILREAHAQIEDTSSIWRVRRAKQSTFPMRLTKLAVDNLAAPQCAAKRAPSVQTRSKFAWLSEQADKKRWFHQVVCATDEWVLAKVGKVLSSSEQRHLDTLGGL
mmetsp:Transcript_94422/g.219379  ORF Transcript_94422/g.219379 Transcript_94422/m.219379 type:complete len:135 (-) Transcript_94422:158-562(-)|eukprot:CAMPEP_0171074548 /NCGR_PEP_ID=MMETSP0766_2-20121228/12214_1 /TAXON_ID=439317 /ORGANISM="Gambierdiscus australes, Strain CAWD 149" /LENGTH=134 /DNA_ID=CAMNT_0011531351 /DNA_START=239 /DNA_END=643 /DNA_ORIENTATION=+